MRLLRLLTLFLLSLLFVFGLLVFGLVGDGLLFLLVGLTLSILILIIVFILLSGRLLVIVGGPPTVLDASVGVAPSRPNMPALLSVEMPAISALSWLLGSRCMSFIFAVVSRRRNNWLFSWFIVVRDSKFLSRLDELVIRVERISHRRRALRVKTPVEKGKLAASFRDVLGLHVGLVLLRLLGLVPERA